MRSCSNRATTVASTACPGCARWMATMPVGIITWPMPSSRGPRRTATYRVPAAELIPGGTAMKIRSADWSGRSASVSGIPGTAPVPTIRPEFGGPPSRSTYGAAITSPARSVGAGTRACTWAVSPVARSASSRLNTVGPLVGADAGAMGRRAAGGDAWLKAKVGATTAPTIAIATRLERKIVVFIIQRSGKVFEIIARAAGRALRALWRPASSRCLTAVGLVVSTAATATTTAEHDQLANVDLSAVPGLTILVLPLPVLDPSLDIELVTLLDVLLDDISQLRPFAVPDDTAMPLGLLLAIARRRVPRPARREPEGRDAVAT